MNFVGYKDFTWVNLDEVGSIRFLSPDGGKRKKFFIQFVNAEHFVNWNISCLAELEYVKDKLHNRVTIAGAHPVYITTWSGTDELV